MTIQKAHMIQRSSTSVEIYPSVQDDNIPQIRATELDSVDWKAKLSQSRINTAELLRYLELENHPLANSEAEKLFELRVPAGYLGKIRKGDPNDPLLLQILPQAAEHLSVAGFSDNPLDEQNYTPVKGVLHKYANRVLLITSAACAINCRYCFRRNFPYAEHRQSRADWQEALDYIRRTPELDEVILSGGDPLIQKNSYLLWLLNELDAIEHISRIRIHTRMLTALPERMDDRLLAGLIDLKTATVIVSHCNHPNELGDDLHAMFSRLKAANITLLNQAVLLKNINDDAQVLARLSKELFRLGILPYYLFMLDPVSGAAHFNVSEESARAIYQQLQSMLPGYLVPRLAREIPGRTSKTLVNLS
jgi:EF-P beta-lysylation protein EpmB